MAFDGKEFGKEIVGVVKTYLAREIAPLKSRLEGLETRLAALPVPKDGRDADPADAALRVREMLAGDMASMRDELESLVPDKDVTAAQIDVAVAKAVAAIPAPKDGKDADPDAVAISVRQMLAADVTAIREELQAAIPDDDAIGARIENAANEAVAKAVASIPAPKDGTDADPAEIAAMVREMLGDDVAAIRDELKNALPDDDAVAAWIDDAVARGLAAMPTPKDGAPGKDGKNGTSVTPEDVAPVIAAEVAKAVDGIPRPKDGVGAAGAFIDRDGNLVLSMTNGAVHNLGRVVGEKGAAGDDGVGFDDLDVAQIDARRFSLRFVKGERVKEFEFAMPVTLDRGFYKHGSRYDAGDGVSWKGGYWIAQKNTGAEPGGNDDWRLAVRRGRDGKDGVMKPAKSKEPVRVGAPAKDD